MFGGFLDVRARARAESGGMDSTTTAISLELHLAGDCLTGTATSSTGVERPFCGWLGLIAAIDSMLADREDSE